MTSVGFYGDGYIELPSHALEKKSVFGFMFRTLQPNAFLLLSAPHHYLKQTDDEKKYAFYSVSLIDGKYYKLCLFIRKLFLLHIEFFLFFQVRFTY